MQYATVRSDMQKQQTDADMNVSASALERIDFPCLGKRM